MKIKTIIIFLLLALPFVGFGQKDSVSAPNKKNLYINAGIGYNLITLLDNIVPQYSNFLGATALTPAINFCLDYGNNKATGGIGIAFQQWWGVDDQSMNLSPNYNYIATTRTMRLNVAYRHLYFIQINKLSDLYWGFHIGFSDWNIYDYIPTTGYATAHTTITNSFTPSVQILLGFHEYFTKNAGIHFEFGIGAPYAAEGGLTFKI